jgi:hypothetical protein
VVSKLILPICLLLGACSSVPEAGVNRDDISMLKPDCSNPGIQIRWLEAQLAQGGYDANRSEYERRYVSQAKELIWTIKSTCLRPVR